MPTIAPVQDSSSAPVWIPPIQRTVATEGKGILELAEAIARHAAHLTHSGDWALRERARLEVELDALISETLVNQFMEDVSQVKYNAALEGIIQRKISPLEAVKSLMNGRLK